MDLNLLGITAALGLAAIGSGIGCGIAGMAAAGAWKKCFALNRPAPFILAAFVGAPLTQTIYGMILMNTIRGAGVDSVQKLGAGIFGGLAIGISAIMQGLVAASAADAYAESRKGFGNHFMAIGVVETIAIFSMVFLMTILQ